MTTIEGLPVSGGIAMASAAVIRTSSTGVEIPHTLVQKGIGALRSGLQPEDYPEVIVICDSLAAGIGMRISGVKTTGIAVQSDEHLSGAGLSVPCVAGLTDLMTVVSDDDIVIVDGNHGVVHIDPDPEMLIHYQEIEERAATRGKVFIASEHIPARTQSGDTVFVYALASSSNDIGEGLDQGADALLVDVRGRESDEAAYTNALLAAAGKPVAFVAGYPDGMLFRAAMRKSAPNQVTVLFPLDDYVETLGQFMQGLVSAAEESLRLDLDPPVIQHGLFVREAEYANSDRGGDESALALDMRRSPYLDTLRSELSEQMGPWIGSRRPEDVIVVLGESIDAVGAAVGSGARSVAVVSGLVCSAKYAIRSVGEEEVA